MKTIIAGSREISGFDLVDRAVIESEFDISEVVSGTAKGIDKEGEGWASYHDIPIRRFPADWRKYGRGAGFVRNEQMADYADALIAIWDGKSSGTKHMINTARKMELEVFVLKVVPHEYR